ncbi:MAG: hypothetical protein KF886_20275 [Candidatus Hydrogenedentes bacterium]|nr:hypothetical protein [Candidatus Hydrogenedentota bacterium]
MRSGPISDQPKNASPLVIPFDRKAIVIRAILGPFIIAFSLVAVLFELLLLLFTGVILGGINAPAITFSLKAAFSGIVYTTYWPKLFDRKPALILTDEYLEDHSAPTSYGRIPWDSIYGIQTASIGFYQGISLFVSAQPQESQTAGPIARELRSWFESFFGSSVQVATDCLVLSRADLTIILQERFEQHPNQSDATREHQGLFVRGQAYTPREEYLVPYVEKPAVTPKD